MIALALLSGSSATSAVPSARAADLHIGQALVLPPAGRSTRRSGTIDNVELAIVRGEWKPPTSQPTTQPGEPTWRAIQPDKDGDYNDRALVGGWCYLPVDSPDDRVVLMTARGDSLVYVNGEPRGGDIYSDGYMTLPVQLHKGTNDFLFTCARGSLRVTFAPPRSQVMFNNADVTSGDVSTDSPTTIGVVVINATAQPVKPIIGGDGKNCEKLGPQIVPAMSLRKIAIDVTEPAIHDKAVLNLTLQAGDLNDATTIGFSKPGGFQKKTFISNIDNSVQYYTVVPATQPSAAKRATVLSLHGAAVEATNQASAYSPKSWCDIVCPTNRRPYGFDWEDWGRLDAIEVLDRFQDENAATRDPSRVYLTGHSMGGHGVWSVASIFPDKFAAIGPSAGWLSFDSYADRRAGTGPATSPATTVSTQPTVAELFKRGTLPSDTPQLMPNLANTGVYALHGIDDDNVPIAQARMGMQILDAFNHDHQLFEKPGVGHWWDDSDEPGAACVDWPPMFDFFARHRLPAMEEVRDIDFRTANPGINGTCFWATIEQQIEPGKMSSIKLHWDALRNLFTGTTKNVEVFSIDFKLTQRPVEIEVDGMKVVGGGFDWNFSMTPLAMLVKRWLETRLVDDALCRLQQAGEPHRSV